MAHITLTSCQVSILLLCAFLLVLVASLWDGFRCKASDLRLILNRTPTATATWTSSLLLAHDEVVRVLMIVVVVVVAVVPVMVVFFRRRIGRGARVLVHRRRWTRTRTGWELDHAYALRLLLKNGYAATFTAQILHFAWSIVFIGCFCICLAGQDETLGRRWRWLVLYLWVY